MRPTRKLFMISVGCAGIVMALLLTAVLATRLMANREMVKSFIVTKTARATGGTLDYDRLVVGFLPLPHLKVEGVHLHRPETFDVDARELSVYPRILPILKGQVIIRRLSLDAPEISIAVGPDAKKATEPRKDNGTRSLEDGIRAVVAGLFGALSAIEPETELRIEQGTVTLAFTGEPDLRVDGINALLENDGGDLSLKLTCTSDLTGTLDASAHADVDAMQAEGQITLTGINLRPLLLHASLPGGITTGKTRAEVKVRFTVHGPETMHGRFGLRFPSLAVMRRDRKLDLDTVAVSGAIDYGDRNLSVSLDTLRAAQPALDLSAVANIRPAGDADGSVIEVRAAASELDVAVAGDVTRAIAGDREEIRTAFSVAKKGHLTHATYFAGFETGGNGIRMTGMKASGHLTQGLVTLPGIEADLEGMDGDVIYEDEHVAFTNVSGRFKGAAFKGVDAAIDWEKESTLSIASRSVVVDTAPLYTWLTGLDGLKQAKKHLETATGTAHLTKLAISGPLTEPAKWSFDISGTPKDLRLKGPLVPFEVRLSGGKITYSPGKEKAAGVKIDFLDASLVSSYQAKGIITPESLTLRMDGSLGPKAIKWLTTVLNIPEHLQMKPPVDLSGVTIAWNDTRTFSFMGGLKTAGGVDLYADLTRSPETWKVRRVQFSDGSSKATASAGRQPAGIEVSFSGNLEKETVDRLLKNNRTLSGRLQGDFRTVIDIDEPMNSSFTGQLTGKGLHIRGLVSDPIDVADFSIAGSGHQITIAPSEISLCNSLLFVDGVVDHGGGLAFDLNVEADRLDEELIRLLGSVGKEKRDAPGKKGPPPAVVPRGDVHLTAGDFTFGGFSWSRVDADIRIDGSDTGVVVHQADLCGISTTGKISFSPGGMSLHITPTARGVSLQESAGCLWHRPVQADARYDLTGEIDLPPSRKNPVQLMSGQLEFSSDNGRIEYANVLMKIFSVLNVTEIFTGGKSDLTEKGYGYTRAYVKAEIGGGKLLLNEILLDGNSLKITGQGSIDLKDRQVDVTLLAAPLKTIDRIVNRIPIISYIAGGSLISVPLRVEGEMSDLSVVPVPPSAVGRGLLHLMERTLKAPFKMMEDAAELVSEQPAPAKTAPIPPQKGP